MKLENLYPDFMSLDEPAQLFFIQEYRKRRALDLSSSVTKTKATTSNFDITDEEKVMMKLLGLKMKDIQALRAIGPIEDDEEGNLFDDSGLVEGDEI